MKTEAVRTFSIGDRVCVKASIPVYHHPQHRGQPFEMQNCIGEVVAILTQWNGKTVSANLPIQVRFDKKFKVHFVSDELDRV